MSEVGRLSAALTLDGAHEFQRQLEHVGRTFTESASKGTAFGQAGAAAFKVAAGATAGLTAAAGGYLAILAKTGGAYNSLQQNSRAALKVMLGGTEQANAQMDKLDAFARNSPFSKSVFIDAQQQMLGFGIESQKVIGYLDAVQNAVAATGGSSQKIAELSTIMSQIQSSAKITAGDLREFGNRGVDAAQLIGSQMGKTAAEIRDEISKGSIDATTALDALAAGMSATFGGTTALVKEQWSGAIDRVKAANRDIGSIIAEPFISKNGGGMAVVWGNQVADVLRAIERQAKPVMDIFMSRGAGMFSGITTSLDQMQGAIKRFNPERIEVGLDKLAGHAPAIAALTGALLAVGGQVGPLGKLFGTLGLTVNPVVAAFAGLLATSPEIRAAFGELVAAGEPLLPVFTELAQVASGMLTTALPVVADGIKLIASAAGPMVDMVSKIPAPVLLGVTAFLALHRALNPLTGSLGAVARSLQGLAERGAVQAALGNTSQGVGMLSAASMSATSSVKGLGTALKTAFLSNPIGIALTVASAAVGMWAMENAKAQEKVQEHQARVAELKGTLNEATGALTEASVAALAQVASTGEMAEHLRAVGTSGQAFVEALRLGGDAAKVFQERVVDSAKSTEAYEKYSGNWKSTADKLGVSLDTLVRSSLGFTDAQQEVDAALQKSGGSFTSLQSDLENTERGIQSHLSSQYAVASSYEAQRIALEEAQETQRRMNESMRESAAAMSETERSNTRMNDALAVARDVTADATDRLNALKQALDELNGGTKSQADLTRDLNEQSDRLREVFQATDENGNNLAASLVGLTGEINTETAAGRALYDSVDELNNKMLDAILLADKSAKARGQDGASMEEAAAAAKPYRDQLVALATEAGLSNEQVAGLVSTMLSTPEMVSFMLDDSGTVDAAKLRLIDLAMQIQATPDGHFEVNENDIPGLREALRLLGIDITTLPPGTVVVKETGASAVEAAINSAARDRTSTITFNVMEHIFSPQPGPVKKNFSGGMYGPGGQHFATGGFASGIYRGVVGGIPKMGVDGTRHIFAEKELGVPWETYISGNPAYRDRNIALLLETARRLSYPLVPLASLHGVPQRNYASGGTAGNAPVIPASPPVSGASGPLVGTVILGDTTKDQFTEFQNKLDFFRRGGR